eukprot:3406548-Pyramimonas_sp.AAC.1
MSSANVVLQGLKILEVSAAFCLGALKQQRSDDSMIEHREVSNASSMSIGSNDVVDSSAATSER